LIRSSDGPFFSALGVWVVVDVAVAEVAVAEVAKGLAGAAGLSAGVELGAAAGAVELGAAAGAVELGAAAGAVELGAAAGAVEDCWAKEGSAAVRVKLTNTVQVEYFTM
jgi:hypothetical protein